MGKKCCRNLHYHVTRKAPRTLSLLLRKSSMRAVRDGASGPGKSRPALLRSDCVRLFARCELKQLCCYRNPDFSVKMSDVSEHSDTRKKEKNGERGSHVIKCLFTEIGRAERENIWRSVRSPLFPRPALPLRQ